MLLYAKNSIHCDNQEEMVKGIKVLKHGVLSNPSQGCRYPKAIDTYPWYRGFDPYRLGCGDILAAATRCTVPGYNRRVYDDLE